MNEPTVQVPVSLIERAAELLDKHYSGPTSARLRALLSQPTPTTEPGTCPRCGGTGEAAGDSHRHDGLPTVGRCNRCGGSGRVSSEPSRLTTDEDVAEAQALLDEAMADPPRIENMAPGTTFTWDGHRLMRMSATAQYAAVDDGGFLFDAASIDPSTIRDVQPPAVTS